MNIEIMRNTLYKAYLDDFAQFTSKLGGATSEVMGDLLSFEVRVSKWACSPSVRLTNVVIREFPTLRFVNRGPALKSVYMLCAEKGDSMAVQYLAVPLNKG